MDKGVGSNARGVDGQQVARAARATLCHPPDATGGDVRRMALGRVAADLVNGGGGTAPPLDTPRALTAESEVTPVELDAVGAAADDTAVDAAVDDEAGTYRRHRCA